MSHTPITHPSSPSSPSSPSLAFSAPGAFSPSCASFLYSGGPRIPVVPVVPGASSAGSAGVRRSSSVNAAAAAAFEASRACALRVLENGRPGYIREAAEAAIAAAGFSAM